MNVRSRRINLRFLNKPNLVPKGLIFHLSTSDYWLFGTSYIEHSFILFGLNYFNRGL